MNVLKQTTTDGRARSAAFETTAGDEGGQGKLVEFHSGGRLLILGDENAGRRAARTIGTALDCTVLLDGPAKADAEREPGIARIHGRLHRLTGYLGNFTATVLVDNREVSVAVLRGLRDDRFDLVLDLSADAVFSQEVPPLGYFRPIGEAELDQALDALPEMVGQFQKPRFFEYDPSICAHGSSGIRACTRCLDACPTQAIASIADRIEVDPYLCQGGGVCATSCPSGAITYAYPPASGLLTRLRSLVKHYREAGGRNACVMFHDRERGQNLWHRIAERVPEWVLPVDIEELGSVGIDAWLATLAYGAGGVALLAPDGIPESVLGEVQHQLSVATAILEGMGESADRVRLLSFADDEGFIEALGQYRAPADGPAATFETFDDKRQTVRLAVDHLHGAARAPRPVVPLPAGSPFGEVWVDGERCTLCMACVAQCPGKALLAGDEIPQLRFIEQNCVQCGLCARSCPEDAIAPSPRYLYDYEGRMGARVLHEEQPFHCIGCGKAFATRKMMERMNAKLAGHWMFRTEEARRRLQMCEDCRVRDLFAREGKVDLHDMTHPRG